MFWFARRRETAPQLASTLGCAKVPSEAERSQPVDTHGFRLPKRIATSTAAKNEAAFIESASMIKSKANCTS
jgi:hypothetical protein